MASITINGNRIEIEGSATNVSVCNGVVTVGGVVVAGDLKGVVRIEWSGPTASVQSDAAITVNGFVGHNVNAGGPVHCGDVGGSVEADGPVHCGAVTGSVTADGPVNCGSVGGNVKANGPVLRR